jgi:hypothetical protein
VTQSSRSILTPCLLSAHRWLLARVIRWKYRLVQHATRKWLELHGTKGRWQQEALKLLAGKFPGGEHQDRETCKNSCFCRIGPRRYNRASLRYPLDDDQNMAYRIVEMVPQHLSTTGAQKTTITHIPKLSKGRLPKSLAPSQESEGEENIAHDNDGKSQTG